MSTPHTPRAMIGAVKTSVRSARSRATAAEALGAGEEVGGVAPAGAKQPALPRSQPRARQRPTRP